MTEVQAAPGDAVLQRAARAMTAGALFAIDPAGVGGICVRAAPGPARDAWLAQVRALVAPNRPWLRVPLNVSDDRLFGGIDLAASLGGGGAVFQSGILMNADGGIVQLSMAERTPPALAARLGTALDSGEIVCERDGFAVRCPVHFGVLAFDEGVGPDEALPAALLDRLGLVVDLDGIRPVDFDARFALTVEETAAARARLPAVQVPQAVLESLCGAGQALGLGSFRTTLFALRVARAIAAADGRDVVERTDAALAAEFVFAPRACALPPAADEDALAPEDTSDDTDDGEEQSAAEESSEAQDKTPGEGPLDDWIVAAAVAAIPPHLLARLHAEGGRRARSEHQGKAGMLASSSTSGRPRPSVQGSLRGGKRLDVLATLRAATPWQRLRPRRALPTDASSSNAPRLAFRPEDIRIRRYQRRTGSVTIFVVDASGSSALHRLAEAKGAVELLLADCYVRRDRVALIAFRGKTADLLLAPTRSLVRAKRSLAGLPGGGGTPLALGLDAAARLAVTVARGGETPLVVVMTDARANVARDGCGDRERARREAAEAARCMRALGHASLLIDTSPRPQADAAALAKDMGATYLPLPHADASAVSAAVRAAGGTVSAPRAPGQRG